MKDLNELLIRLHFSSVDSNETKSYGPQKEATMSSHCKIRLRMALFSVKVLIEKGIFD